MLKDGTVAGQYMEIAFELAEMGRGRTNPNPMVGAVIVKDGRVVGEGRHAKAGGPHAEIEALGQARAAARGATLYVTLEPCCHRGRTGPCTDEIIKAGIKEVMIGVLDPNPLVSGRGVKALKAAGLAVSVGDSGKIARQNEVYFKFIQTKRPFVLVKIAMSLDGKIAAKVGARSNLTDAKAKLEVHKLRNEYQAVLVGIGTVLIDDPLLNCRLEGGDVRQPIRVIVDSSGRLPLDSRIVGAARADRVILAATEKMPKGRRRDLAGMGVETIFCATNERGQVDINDLLGRLGDLEITSVLAEGGALLNEELLAEELADKMLLFQAPLVIGGHDSVPMVAGNRSIRQNWQPAECRLVGNDVMLEVYPVGKS